MYVDSLSKLAVVAYSLFLFTTTMQTIRDIINGYVKDDFKDNSDCEAFLKYYEPDFDSMYKPESVREVVDYKSILLQWINTDASDERLEFVLDDMKFIYHANKPR